MKSFSLQDLGPLSDKNLLITSSPFECGMEEYNASTSIETRRQPGGTVRPSNALSRSRVSWIYEGMVLTCGLRYSSTSLLARSVFEPMPETRGRPGGSSRFLWVLGSEYKVGILG